MNLKEENMDALSFKGIEHENTLLFWWTYVERILLLEMLIVCNFIFHKHIMALLCLIDTLDP